MLKFFSSCFGRRQPQTSGPPSSSAPSASSQSTDPSAVEEVSEASSGFHRHFSLHDLRLATQNFHPDNLLGRGGFGGVYKGVLRDGTEVAVKKLGAMSHQGKGEFLNEVQLLSTVQHRNLVRLIGCCADGAEKLLVYEYLKNRSLHQALLEPGSQFVSMMEWSIRRKIILGAAKGLAYLHEDSRVRIIHRDIKASNILLDNKFQPKIADFGLAKLFDLEQTHVSTRVAGTFGYLAPEYALNGRLTDKADVYSFGVVMLEVVSGRKHTNLHATWKNQRLMEVAWRLHRKGRALELVDLRMGDRYVPEEVDRVIHVALLCTQAGPELRPSMSRVVALLNGRSQISEQPTKPPLLSSGNHSKNLKQPRHLPDEGTSSGTSGSSTKASFSSIFSR